MISQQKFIDAEKQVSSILNAHAKKISGITGMTFDEASQEQRIALLRAIEAFDPDKGVNFLSFANRCLKNNCLSVIYRETAERRRPKFRLEDIDGFEESLCDDVLNPEQQALTSEAKERQMKFCLQLYSRLGDRERLVFDCKVRPSDELVRYARENSVDISSTKCISGFLGFSRNAVDYANHKIRSKFTKLAEEAYPELLTEHGYKHIWPGVFVSNKHDDFEFKCRVIRERKLDFKLLSLEQKTLEDCEMKSEAYSWGHVLFLKFKHECATVVIEGCMNFKSGVVFGKDKSARIHLSDYVKFYKRLRKVLA